jgi:GAF domain-containing protein
MGDAPKPMTLDEAQRLIASQEEEIGRLRQRIEDDRLATELRDLLVLAKTTGIIGSPVDHDKLLEMILATAAHVTGARAGSLFVVDERAAELVFEVGIGVKAQSTEKFRVPLGEGLAGLVAATGQPMAVANADEDQHLLEEIKHTVGFEPQSLMAMPLAYGDHVIGVLELLDKEGDGAFSQSDMQALALFAHQAAVALELSRTYRNVAPLIGQVIASIDDKHDSRKVELRERAERFAANLEQEPAYSETLELAQLVQLVAWKGDAELAACRKILEVFSDYVESRPTLSGMSGV